MVFAAAFAAFAGFLDDAAEVGDTGASRTDGAGNERRYMQ
jgi:hypothetical protein